MRVRDKRGRAPIELLNAYETPSRWQVLANAVGPTPHNKLAKEDGTALPAPTAPATLVEVDRRLRTYLDLRGVRSLRVQTTNMIIWASVSLVACRYTADTNGIITGLFPLNGKTGADAGPKVTLKGLNLISGEPEDLDIDALEGVEVNVPCTIAMYGSNGGVIPEIGSLVVDLLPMVTEPVANYCDLQSNTILCDDFTGYADTADMIAKTNTNSWPPDPTFMWLAGYGTLSIDPVTGEREVIQPDFMCNYFQSHYEAVHEVGFWVESTEQLRELPTATHPTGMGNNWMTFGDDHWAFFLLWNTSVPNMGGGKRYVLYGPNTNLYWPSVSPEIVGDWPGFSAHARFLWRVSPTMSPVTENNAGNNAAPGNNPAGGLGGPPHTRFQMWINETEDDAAANWTLMMDVVLDLPWNTNWMASGDPPETTGMYFYDQAIGGFGSSIDIGRKRIKAHLGDENLYGLLTA